MSDARLPEPFDSIAIADTSRRTLAKGESLFVQGEMTAGLFYLMSGAMNLVRTTRTGHALIIHRVHDGEFFAEASLFSDTYHCTATAIRNCRLVAIHRAEIERRLATDIEFTRKLTRRFTEQIQDRRRRVELSGIRSAEERILAAMEDGLLLDDISIFAESIGLARETTYRTLGKLVAEGKLVKSARGCYQLY
ncbi:MAG: Crp/Fnr family transcriptional regulator [Granulosicoccus sp.]|nr:Crp/Fnr family transcriptional regulator [Granulosicoccus sp.]